MSYLRKRYRGRHTYRLKENPLERRFSQAWQHLNRFCGDRLDWVDMLSGEEGVMGHGASDRERESLNTAMQWLGSPVGFIWLMETLGFPDVRTADDLRRLQDCWKKRG